MAFCYVYQPLCRLGLASSFDQQARGAVLIAAAKSNIEIYEYSARKIKLSLTGNGNANKQQVKFMVTNLLKLSEPVKSNDASDALAIAICYMLQNRLGELWLYKFQAY